LRRLEVKLQCFFQIGKSLFFALALAGDIDFEALRNIPVPFTPDGRSERSLHYHILSHDGQVSQYRNYASIFVTTLPATSVNRKSRPMWW
jgi:hypothetical protein